VAQDYNHSRKKESIRMSHELSMRKDGTAEMFSLRETPWHKLGKVLPEEITDDQVLEEAGLNWEVKQEEVFIREPGGPGLIAIEGYKALKRSDNNLPLSIVGDRYRVFQNHEMVKAMRLIAKDLHVVWEAAGALRGGQVVWTLGYMPDLIYNVKNDAIKTYMAIVNGHGNAKSLMLMPTTVRIVCSNTLRMATDTRAGAEATRLKNASDHDYSDVALSEGFSIRHNGSLPALLSGVIGAYSDIVKDAKATQEVSEAMAATKMARNDSQAYWRAVFGLEAPAGLDEAERVKAMRRDAKIISKLDQIADSPTCNTDGIKDTLWAALQACTEYIDHHDVSDTTSAARRFQTANFGTGVALKSKAWDEALDLIGT